MPPRRAQPQARVLIGRDGPFPTGEGREPSPVHASDSEETFDNKMRWRWRMWKRWRWWGWKVLYRLRQNARLQRRRRRAAVLAGRNFLPTAVPMAVAMRIAEFLG